LPSASALLSISITTDELLRKSFFQALIWVGCRSYFLLKASMVCCSLMALMVTLTLNSAVNLRRLFLFMFTGLKFINFYLNNLSKESADYPFLKTTLCNIGFFYQNLICFLKVITNNFVNIKVKHFYKNPSSSK
jgi:hypothetical protein